MAQRSANGYPVFLRSHQAYHDVDVELALSMPTVGVQVFPAYVGEPVGGLSTFTAADGTLLLDYVPDAGPQWAEGSNANYGVIRNGYVQADAYSGLFNFAILDLSGEGIAPVFEMSSQFYFPNVSNNAGYRNRVYFASADGNGYDYWEIVASTPSYFGISHPFTGTIVSTTFTYVAATWYDIRWWVVDVSGTYYIAAQLESTQITTEGVQATHDTPTGKVGVMWANVSSVRDCWWDTVKVKDYVPPALVHQSLFTVANGTRLQNYTPDLGNSWVETADGSGWEIYAESNYMRGTEAAGVSGGGFGVTHTPDIAGGDYELASQFQLVTSLTSSYAWFTLHCENNTSNPGHGSNDYVAIQIINGYFVDVRKFTGTGSTRIVSQNNSGNDLVLGTWYGINVSVVGDQATISGIKDWPDLTFTIPSDRINNEYIGFHCNSNSSSKARCNYDAFEVTA